MTARLWTGANALLGAMFVFSMIVQVNDPDPLLWMLIYGAAAAVSFAEVRRRTQWWAAGGVGVIALLWAGTIAPRVVGQVPFLSMFEEFEMKDIHVEESREMYGLILIALWMLAVMYAATARRRRARATAPGTGS